MLVAVGIALVLVGLLLPAYREARRSAYMTVDSSNLHQVDVGRRLYESDTDDVPVFKLYQLVRSGYVTKTCVISPLDFTDMGIGNVWLEHVGEPHRREPYRLTYVSVGDAHLIGTIEQIRSDQSFGWLASLASGRYHPKTFEPFDGKFLRLSESGAVWIKHEPPLTWIGNHTTEYSSLAPFVDHPESYLAEK
ncbi:MAG: hypothetical protein KF857_12455 [Fimbriimonadaceae bacterium]|nr:hypothetical protein [Fimbriimonadaceae bacterium]